MVLTYVKLNLRFTDKAPRTAEQTKIHIVSLYTIAFIAGSMNMIYQVERLPLMVAILIHGIVLYIGYIATYLVNGWLEWGITPILVFSGVFVLGYFLIWAVIYCYQSIFRLIWFSAVLNTCCYRVTSHDNILLW